MITSTRPATTERSEALSNPFRLPRGEKLRREVVAVFREQRDAILRYLRTGGKGGDGVKEGLRRVNGPPCLSLVSINSRPEDREKGHGPNSSTDPGAVSINSRSEDRKNSNPIASNIVRAVRTKDQASDPPIHWPTWHDFGLGALDIKDRMTPILTATWDDAADKFAPRVGLDPDSWSVVNPHTEAMINGGPWRSVTR